MRMNWNLHDMERGSLWGSMVEFATVDRYKEVTFTFRDCMEIRA